MGRKRQQSRTVGGPPPGSIGQLVEYLLGKPWRSAPRNDFCAWPPDTFAIAATLLRESGAYLNVLDAWPPGGSLKRYASGVKQQGKKWSTLLLPGSFQAPASIAEMWREVYKLRNRPLNDANEVWQSLVQLCAIADAASPNLLTWWTDSSQPTSWQMRKWIGDNIADEDLGVSNLCSRRVARSNVIVMPKMRTPQTGMTLRSMSHNLALMPNMEVKPVWRPTNLGEADRFREQMKLLVFPWPLEMHPVQFQPVEIRPERNLAEPYRYFEFRPDGDVGARVELVGRAYAVATQRFGRIDGVVFPEMALDVHTFNRIVERLAWEDAALIIGGVYEPASEGSFATNEARIVCFYGASELNAPALKSYEQRQQKHHGYMISAMALDDKTAMSELGLNGGATIPARRRSNYLLFPTHL